VTSQKSKWTVFAIAGVFVLTTLLQCSQAALAILPPHGPNFGLPENNDGSSAHRHSKSSDMAQSSLFLLRSNPKERIDAQVQISTLNDKISHLEDPSFIIPDVDTTKFSPEVIERAISVIRLHYLATLLTERGTLLAVVGDTDKAIADLGEALDSDNKNFRAYNNRACLKAAGGDFDGALADANKALSLSPKFAEAYDTRGAVYLAKRQYSQAEKDFDRAIAEKPRYAEAFYHRSLVMQAIGKNDAYAADLKKAKDLGY
jgi:tetratricopeptide (TPR) repeat protein